jgi:hypothetical protein
MLLGGGFVDWHPFQHPLYGDIEIGGFRKDVGRVPPSFLIEEMLHRNALFAIRHAAAMPRVVIEETLVTDLGDGLLAVDVVLRNENPIPTRTQRAADKRIGSADVLSLEGSGLQVLAGGIRTDRFRPELVQLAEREPERLLLEQGVAGRSQVRARWFVRGKGKASVHFQSDKARSVRVEVDLGHVGPAKH